jgi:hypothetical protein
MSTNPECLIAREAYFGLFQAGLNSLEILEVLVGRAVLETSTPSAKAGVQRPSNRNIQHGISPRFSKELPALINRVNKPANAIEKLNALVFFKPKTWVKIRKLPGVAKTHFGFWFEQLPLLLRHYAAFMEAHSKPVRVDLEKLGLAKDRPGRNKPY